MQNDSPVFLTFPTKKITFLHLSTIGVCNPYSLTQGKPLNNYESSKLCAEYIIESSFRSAPNVSYLLLRPSTVLHDSSFLNKYFLLFLFFPFRINSDHFIVPYIHIDELTTFIVQQLLNRDLMTSTIALSSIHSLYDLHLSFVRKSRIFNYLSRLKLSCDLLFFSPFSTFLLHHLPGRVFSIKRIDFTTLIPHLIILD